MKLWDKGYNINKEIEKFTVGDDYLLDQKLLYWDCIGSVAHAMMLNKIGIINDDELYKIKKTLFEIVDLDKQGKFKIKQEDEDSHTAIENYLINKLSDTGKKIHTARSRNDQVLVNLKLYMKKELFEIQELVLDFCKTLLEFTKNNNIVFPGYTHMQKAMPSTVALWSGGFIESMLDNLKVLNNTFEIIDSCPLGSAAGYGVSLDIDRKYVSDLLGFSKVQNNVLYVQKSRGKNEALVLSSLMNIMMDMNKIASDLILFSMQEFGYFELPKEFCTGSSIMPQKKNPDVLELLRAKSKIVESLYFQVTGIVQNLQSGYNRDFQLTKKPLIDGIEITKTSLNIINEVFKCLKVNKENCEKALTKDIFATDIAYEYVKNGMTFRDAYRNIAKELDNIKVKDVYKHVSNKRHVGTAGNLGLDEIELQIKNNIKSLYSKKMQFQSVMDNLLDNNN